jgi:uncharacterized membrane protein
MTVEALEVMNEPLHLVRAALRRWPARWIAALVLLAAFAVACRLPYLTERSLWYDEASSWQTAKFPLVELITSVRKNVHMPLYYLLLKGWMVGLGESVAALRGFSISFGALTVIATGLFGRDLLLLSAAVSTYTPIWVDYNHLHARVYVHHYPGRGNGAP